jgi:adenylate cyclase
MRLRVRFLGAGVGSGKRGEIPCRVKRIGAPQSGYACVVAVSFEDPKLANSTLSELLRLKVRHSSALLGIVQALSPTASVEEVIESLCGTTASALEARQVLLFLSPTGESVLRAGAQGDKSGAEFQIARGEGLIGQVAATGILANVPVLRDDARFRPELEPYFDDRARSALCVPLREEAGAARGVLLVVDKRYGPFTSEDEQLGSAIAQQISAVLREARLFEEIRSLKTYNERILHSIASGVITFDPSGSLRSVNRAARELFNLQVHENTVKDYAAFFDRSNNPRLCSLLDNVLSTKQARTAYDIRFLRNDGGSLSLNLKVLPLWSGREDFLGCVVVAEDITQEQRLMNTFCRYVAREVAEQVMQGSHQLELGGRRAAVSILMLDIRNFTTLSEQLSPEEVVALLNSYFPPFINVIFRHHGMVDKFIGDAILAVFGVPIPHEDDALRAVRAAQEIQQQVRLINQERVRQNRLTIEIGIGITSGEVICGNIGSERRMDYTVIGDPVNLASRLEGLTKQVAHKILINDRIRAAVEKDIPCEPLGMFKIKGKQEEVPVFAIQTLG